MKSSTRQLETDINDKELGLMKNTSSNDSSGMGSDIETNNINITVVTADYQKGYTTGA